jgi:Na+-driven multidrug efflux pump
MPLALAAAFMMNMGLTGLWSGFVIANVVLDVGFYFIIETTNWDKVAYLTHKRLAYEHIVPS